MIISDPKQFVLRINRRKFRLLWKSPLHLKYYYPRVHTYFHHQQI